MRSWSVGKAARLVVVVGVLAVGLGFVGVSGISGQSVSDVEVRDRLIADQEALLNVYRCMFGVDVEVVPGGCSGGVPASPAKDPSPFSGDPTAQDIAVRDNLIADQEALLNVYRCRFRIDMQQVPGGCPEPVNEPDEESEIVQQGGYQTCVDYTYEWCLLADGSWRAILAYRSPSGPSDGAIVCGAREVLSDNRSKCISATSSSRHYEPEELEIFPMNCPPSLSEVTGPGIDIKSTFSDSRGLCTGYLTRWWYDIWHYTWFTDAGQIEGVCNRRDNDLNRLEDVCLPPGTDVSTLEPWQYVAAPSGVPSWEQEDRTNDPQAQRPYLYHDLPVMEEFCSQYPVVHESCTYFFGT